MHKACAKTIPPKAFLKHKRPGWNSSVNAAHRHSKAAWKLWKASGKPNCPTNPVRELHFKAKRDFRKTLRAWKHEQDFLFYSNMDLNHNSDKLFRLLRNKSGTQPNLTNHIHVDKQIFSGNRILKGWANHFESLGQPSSHNYDELFLHSINEELDNMSSQSHSQPNTILNNLSEDEVYKAIQSLKLGTAPGPDQIQPEHIFYGGATLVTHMTALFNQMVEQEHIPQIFQHGLIIPIPKSSDKDPSDASNYRGFTLVSLIAKIFEKVILLRLQVAGIPDQVHPLQGAFNPGVSCIHTEFIFQEAIQHLREQKQKAHVALLDVQKAFHTVWHNGLFYKLYHYGIQDNTWQILRKWYI